MAGVSPVFNLATKYADDIVGIFCRKANPMNIEGLHLAPKAIGDTVTFSKASQNFASRIDSMSPAGQGSATLKKIFSPEFKPTRRFDENGYMITTVIDKKTQKPVEIFIKEVKEDFFEFYKKIGKNYKIIGKRSYRINKELGVIEPGYMTNYYKEELSGIGIRGHQLAVEKAIKENMKCVYLDSLPRAEVFHEKCLFRPAQKMKINSYDFKGYIKNICEILSITPKEAEKIVVYKKIGESYIMDLEQTVIKLNKILAQKSPEDLITHPTMGMYSLSDETLELWKDLVRSQPITL